jgi:DNA modification methylase
LRRRARRPQGQPAADLVFADPPYDADPDWHGSWIARVRAGAAARRIDLRLLRLDVLGRDPGGARSATSRCATASPGGARKGRGAKRNWKQNMEDIWFATKGDDYTFNLVKWKKPVIAPYRVNGKPKDWVEENGERFRMTHPSNIWTDLCVPFWSMPENTPHPYQKPEKLVERVDRGVEPAGRTGRGSLPGSGTTAVVARRLKRKFLGFERDPDHVRLALKRLRERG